MSATHAMHEDEDMARLGDYAEYERKAWAFLLDNEKFDVMVADAEEYVLNRRVAILWAPLRCLTALLKWARRAQRKM